MLNKLKLMQLIQIELHHKNNGNEIDIITASVNMFNHSNCVLVLQYLDGDSKYTLLEEVFSFDVTEDELMDWLEVLQNERV